METDTKIDARALAWEADRIAWADLSEDQQRWFVNLELFVNRELAELQQQGLEDGALEENSDGDYNMHAVQAFEKALGLELDDVDEPGEIAELVAVRLQLEREEGKKDALVPSRESARTKAMRLLLEARLDVIRHDIAGQHKGLIHARVRGDSGKTYDLGYDPHSKRWRCTCEEMKGNCSHLAALKMVTTITEA